MKRLFIFLFSLSPLTAQEVNRTWTNAEGKTLEGTYLGDSNGQAKLQLANQRIVLVDPATLSEADQTYIRETSEKLARDTASAKLKDRKAKWLTDYDQAVEESKDTGLPLLMLFTGSDWCPYCIQLEKNVLSEKEFKDYANQNLVLFIADFPRGGSRRSLEKQNEALKQKFHVKGYPTLLLSTGDPEKPTAIRSSDTPARMFEILKAAGVGPKS